MYGRGYGPGFRGFPGPGGQGFPGRFGPRGFGPHLFPGGGFLFMLAALVVLGVIVFALWHAFRKAGLEGGWSLLALVPFVGLPVAIVFLAFTDWPALRELQQWRAWAAAQPAVPPVPAEVPTAAAAEAPTEPIDAAREPGKPKSE